MFEIISDYFSFIYDTINLDLVVYPFLAVVTFAVLAVVIYIIKGRG